MNGADINGRYGVKSHHNDDNDEDGVDGDESKCDSRDEKWKSESLCIVR